MALSFRLQAMHHTIKLGISLVRPVCLGHKIFLVDKRRRLLTALSHYHLRLLSSQVAAHNAPEANDHDIPKNTEKPIGESSKHEFQSETRMLLEIVAKSLYSDKEVFVRELVSNASDALEKLRYLRLSEELTNEAGGDQSLEIYIATDKQNRILTIQDTGVGMTKEELISNLGTIARSGSKAFLQQLRNKQDSTDSSEIIGQFGVGFYSAFMVADKVEVYTKSYAKNAKGLYWVYNGTGSYEMSSAAGVQPGTKIILHLRTDCREFADDTIISGIIKKYSNFVGSPIFINGKRVNGIQPLWMRDPKKVTPQEHTEFYRYVGNTYAAPRFVLHYSTDVPLSIRALLYFPEEKPASFQTSRDSSIGVSLYSRKVLIKSNADNILPKWLRFVKGVIDSEDIPLNLSREFLQNSALIGKLRIVLTTRILRFLHDKSVKQSENFGKFYKDYGLFLKEGIVTSYDQFEKEEIGKLLRFESSKKPSGELVSLPQYVSGLSAEQKDIYYLAAPSRALAEQSPYYESLKKRGIEVLFCYEPYDELVLMQLGQYNSRFLTSAEKEMRQNTEASRDDNFPSIDSDEINKLVGYMKKVLSNKAHEIRTTKSLESHPCVITVEDIASARQFIRTPSNQLNEANRYTLLQPRLEINPNHPIIKKLSKLITTDPNLAVLLTQQLFTGAMVGAGLVEDPRMLLTSINELLCLALEKH